MMQQQSNREQGGEGGHQVADGEDCGGARRRQQQQSVKGRGNATPAPPTPTTTASFASPPTSSTNNQVGNAALISSNGNGNAANPPKTPTIRRKQQLISPGCAAVRVWPAGTESTQPAKADSKGVNNKAAVPMSREELQPIFTDLNGQSQEKGSQKSTATEKEGRENGLSAFPTALNFVKGMLGPGCLSIPLIFRQSGLIMGLLLIFLFGLVSTKCMLQLVNCSQHLSKKKRHQFLDYGDVAFEALAQGFRPLRQYAEMGRVAVNASIVCLQVGICSVSVVFLAAHLKQVFDELFSISLGQQQWILLVAGPLILINFIRTLHKIVFLSIIGSVFMFSALIIIFQHLLRAKHISLWGLPWFTDLNGVISAAGAVLYAYEGQAMVLPLENKLRDPSQMGGPLGILSSSMGFVSLVYALCGFIGFATYGQQVKGSIALNLPQDEILFTAVRLMLTLVVFVGFVIQQYVVVEIVWPKVRAMLFARRHSSSKIFFWEMGLRTALVLLAVTIAYVVPNLERIIPLVGMSAGMLLAIVFPAFLDTLTFLPAEIEHGQMGKCFARLAQNSMLGLIGLFALIGGVEANLVDLIQKNG